MKLLFVINSLHVGGAERQVVTDANLLASEGVDITVACYDKGELARQLNPAIHVILLPGKNEFKSGFELFKIIRSENFDFIFAHMFWALKVIAIPAFLTGHKVVFFEHGLGLWRKFYHLFLISLNELFVKKIVVVSNKKKKVKLEREKSSRKKIQVIPNSFMPPHHSSVNHLVHEDGIFKIIFMGRFNAVKQLHLLPLVAGKLCEMGARDFRFVLCGSGQEEAKIQQIVNEQRVNAYFDFPGYVQEPYSLLTEGNVFILPSRIEDFSVALLEAASAYLPLMAFDVGGNSEIIQDGWNGYLVTPFNIDDFARKLYHLMQNPQLRLEMGHNAHQFVVNHFTEKHRLTHLKNLIKSL